MCATARPGASLQQAAAAAHACGRTRRCRAAAARSVVAARAAVPASPRRPPPPPPPPLPPPLAALACGAAAAALSLSCWAAPVAAAPPPAVGAPVEAAAASPRPQLLAQLAARVTLGEPQFEKDPVQPFTLYGTIYKKYLIERLQGEKIVSREKGVTARACVSAIREAAETPDVVGLPIAAKAERTAVAPSCASVALPGRFERVSDIRPACVPACRGACTAALDAHAVVTRATTGYALAADDAERLGKACARVCGVECTKPGKFFDFAVPFRP